MRTILWLAVVALAFSAGFIMADQFDANGRLLISCANADGSKC